MRILKNAFIPYVVINSNTYNGVDRLQVSGSVSLDLVNITTSDVLVARNPITGQLSNTNIIYSDISNLIQGNSTEYIQNQFLSAQTSDFWINGKAIIGSSFDAGYTLYVKGSTLTPNGFRVDGGNSSFGTAFLVRSSTNNVLEVTNTGRVLIDNSIDNGIDALQINGTLRLNLGTISSSDTIVFRNTSTGQLTDGTISYSQLQNAVMGAGTLYIQNQITSPQTANYWISGRAIIGNGSDNTIDTLQIKGSLSLIPVTINNTDTILSINTTGQVSNTNISYTLLNTTVSGQNNNYIHNQISTTQTGDFRISGRAIIGTISDDLVNKIQVNGNIRLANTGEAYLRGPETSFYNIIAGYDPTGYFYGYGANIPVYIASHNTSRIVFNNDSSPVLTSYITSKNTIFGGTGVDVGYRVYINGTGATSGGLLVDGYSSISGSSALFRNLAGQNILQILNAGRILINNVTDNNIDQVQIAGTLSLNLGTVSNSDTIVARNISNGRLTNTLITHQQISNIVNGTAGTYILNQTTSAQSASYWIDGRAIIGNIDLGPQYILQFTNSSGPSSFFVASTNTSSGNAIMNLLRGSSTNGNSAYIFLGTRNGNGNIGDWAFGSGVTGDNTSNLGFYSYGSNDLVLTMFKNTGNVYIGASASDNGFKFDVQGSSRFQNNITITGSSSQFIVNSSNVNSYNVILTNTNTGTSANTLLSTSASHGIVSFTSTLTNNFSAFIAGHNTGTTLSTNLTLLKVIPFTSLNGTTTQHFASGASYDIVWNYGTNNSGIQSYNASIIRPNVKTSTINAQTIELQFHNRENGTTQEVARFDGFKFLLGTTTNNNTDLLQVSGTVRLNLGTVSATDSIVSRNTVTGQLTDTNFTYSQLTSLVSGSTNNYIQNQTSTNQSASFRITGDGIYQGSIIIGATVNPNTATYGAYISGKSILLKRNGVALNQGIEIDNDIKKYSIYNDYTSNNLVFYDNTLSINRLSITNSGNITINTNDNSRAKFQVYSDVTFNNANSIADFSGSGTLNRVNIQVSAGTTTYGQYSIFNDNNDSLTLSFSSSNYTGSLYLNSTTGPFGLLNSTYNLGFATNNIIALNIFANTNNLSINSNVDQGYRVYINSTGSSNGGLLVDGISGTFGDIALFRNASGIGVFRVLNNYATVNTGTMVFAHQTFTGQYSATLSGNNTFNFTSSSIGSVYTIGPSNRFFIHQALITQSGLTVQNNSGLDNGRLISVNSILPQSSGSQNIHGIEFTYTINNTGSYSGFARGIFYNPTLTNLTGTTHYAIQTVTGDVLLGSTSGRIILGGTTNNLIDKLQVYGTVRLNLGTISNTDTIVSRNTSTGQLTDTNFTYGQLTGLVSGNTNSYIQNQTSTVQVADFRINGTGELKSLYAYDFINIGDSGSTQRGFNYFDLEKDSFAVYSEVRNASTINDSIAGVGVANDTTSKYAYLAYVYSGNPSTIYHNNALTVGNTNIAIYANFDNDNPTNQRIYFAGGTTSYGYFNTGGNLILNTTGNAISSIQADNNNDKLQVYGTIRTNLGMVNNTDTIIARNTTTGQYTDTLITYQYLNDFLQTPIDPNDFIQNQFISSQTADFWISGKAIIGSTTDTGYKVYIASDNIVQNGLRVDGGTSTTGTALLVKNSSTQLLQVLNNGRILINNYPDNNIDSLQVSGTIRIDLGVYSNSDNVVTWSMTTGQLTNTGLTYAQISQIVGGNSTAYIQNQIVSAQSLSNYWISGRAIIGTGTDNLNDKLQVKGKLSTELGAVSSSDTIVSRNITSGQLTDTLISYSDFNSLNTGSNANYIWNTTSQQPSSNFYISGLGRTGRLISGIGTDLGTDYKLQVLGSSNGDINSTLFNTSNTSAATVKFFLGEDTTNSGALLHYSRNYTTSGFNEAGATLLYGGPNGPLSLVAGPSSNIKFWNFTSIAGTIFNSTGNWSIGSNTSDNGAKLQVTGLTTTTRLIAGNGTDDGSLGQFLGTTIVTVKLKTSAAGGSPHLALDRGTGNAGAVIDIYTNGSQDWQIGTGTLSGGQSDLDYYSFGTNTIVSRIFKTTGNTWLGSSASNPTDNGYKLSVQNSGTNGYLAMNGTALTYDGTILTVRSSAGGTSFPSTTGSGNNAGGVLRLGRDNAVLDVGSASATGMWLQSTNRLDFTLNYGLFLNPNGGNIIISSTSDNGAKLQVTGLTTTTRLIAGTGTDDSSHTVQIFKNSGSLLRLDGTSDIYQTYTNGATVRAYLGYAQAGGANNNVFQILQRDSGGIEIHANASSASGIFKGFVTTNNWTIGSSSDLGYKFGINTTGTNGALFVGGRTIITAGTLGSGQIGLDFSATSQSTFNQYGSSFTLNAGGTTSNIYSAGRFVNNTAGIGTALFAGSNVFNSGLSAYAQGNTATGYNVAVVGYSISGKLSVGTWGNSISAGNGQTAIGAGGIAYAASASPTGNTNHIGVYGYIGSVTTTPTYLTTGNAANAAAIFDNGDTTSDIAQFRDNGAISLRVLDGGNLTGSGNASFNGNITAGNGSSNAYVFVNRSTSTTAGYFILNNGNSLWFNGVGATTPGDNNYDFYNYTTASNNARIFSTTGNWNFGTGTSDNGYKVDITNAGTSGALRVQGNSLLATNTLVDTQGIATNSIRRLVSAILSIDGENSISGSNSIRLRYVSGGLYSTPNQTHSMVEVSGGTSQTTGTNVWNAISINPGINNTSGTNTIRGIYYNPTIASLTGTTHIAFENTTGDNLFNSSSGRTVVGSTTNNGIFQLVVRGLNYPGLLVQSGNTGTNTTSPYDGFAFYLNIDEPHKGIITNWDNTGISIHNQTGAQAPGLNIFPTTNNIGIATGTTADTGFKLYVNGTVAIATLGTISNSDTIVARNVTTGQLTDTGFSYATLTSLANGTDGDYIQNRTSQQSAANYNIDGTGIAGRLIAGTGDDGNSLIQGRSSGVAVASILSTGSNAVLQLVSAGNTLSGAVDYYFGTTLGWRVGIFGIGGNPNSDYRIFNQALNQNTLVVNYTSGNIILTNVTGQSTAIADNGAKLQVTGRQTITAGTLTAGQNALSITGTLGVVGAAIDYIVTPSNGGGSWYASRSILNSGNTSSSFTSSFFGQNNTAGIGTDLIGQNSGNIGVFGFSSSATNGHNAGVLGASNGGKVNYGTLGSAVNNGINAANIGAFGAGLNASAGSAQIGVLGYLGTSTPTYLTTITTASSAAGIFDNGATTSDILQLRDNATIFYRALDGGSIIHNPSITSTSLATSPNSVYTFSPSISDTNTGSNTSYSLFTLSPTITVNGGSLSGQNNYIAAITPTLTNTGGTNDINNGFAALRITPSYTGFRNIGVRGIYYAPTNNATGTVTIVAFENTVGNVLLGTTSGKTYIGDATTESGGTGFAQRLQIRDSLNAPLRNVANNTSTGSSSGVGWYMINDSTATAAIFLNGSNNTGLGGSGSFNFIAPNTVGTAYAFYAQTTGLLTASNFAATGNWNFGTSTTDSGYKVDITSAGTVGAFRSQGRARFTSSTVNNVEIGLGNNNSDYPIFGYNIKFTGTNNSFQYQANDVSHAIQFGGSGNTNLNFYVAPTGTANNSISYGNIALSIFPSTTAADNGNIILGSATNGGFKLDITTTGLTGGLRTQADRNFLRFLEINAGINAATTGQGIRIDSADSSFRLQGSVSAAVLNTFLFEYYTVGSAIVASNKNLVTFTGGTSNTSGSFTYNTLNLTPTYNNTGTVSATTVRGIYYNPTLTSLTSTTHIAFENTTGDVYFNTTGGNVNIGNTTSQIITSRFQIKESTQNNVLRALVHNTNTGNTSASSYSLANDNNILGIIYLNGSANTGNYGGANSMNYITTNSTGVSHAFWTNNTVLTAMNFAATGNWNFGTSTAQNGYKVDITSTGTNGYFRTPDAVIETGSVPIYLGNNNSDFPIIGSNIRRTGTNNTWNYAFTSVAYKMNLGTTGGTNPWTFDVAPSGTGGTPITFTNAMSIFSSTTAADHGNIALGSTTNNGYKLDITTSGTNGALRVQGTVYITVLGTISNTDTIVARNTTTGQLTNTNITYSSLQTAANGRFKTSIGNGTNTSFSVTHNLASLDVMVYIYDNNTGEQIFTTVTHTSINVVTIDFSPVIPTTNQYRVLILAI